MPQISVTFFRADVRASTVNFKGKRIFVYQDGSIKPVAFDLTKEAAIKMKRLLSEGLKRNDRIILTLENNQVTDITFPENKE